MSDVKVEIKASDLVALAEDHPVIRARLQQMAPAAFRVQERASLRAGVFVRVDTIGGGVVAVSLGSSGLHGIDMLGLTGSFAGTRFVLTLEMDRYSIVPNPFTSPGRQIAEPGVQGTSGRSGS